MLLYWIWLAQLSGVTAHQKAQLLRRFSTAEDIYFASDGMLSEMSPALRKALESKDLGAAEKILNDCRKQQIGILTYADDRYPDRLRNILDPPTVLYYKGTLPDFSAVPTVGIVGTRRATPYGIAAAKMMGRQIASCGGLVISGGAAGIDTAAMIGAMEAGKPVVGVFGSGVDVYYPRTNRTLFEDVQRSGCLISEYPPGSAPQSWHFPQRNRIISGLSDGVLIVEAPVQSGALITARLALEQGRDVFSVPGNIGMKTSDGSNLLLREGAAAVLTGWDVMKEYAEMYPGKVTNALQQTPLANIERRPPLQVAQPEIPPFDRKDIDNSVKTPYSDMENPDISAEERQVLSALDITPRSIDEIIARTDLPPSDVLRILTKLAVKDIIINHPGRMFSVGNTGK